MKRSDDVIYRRAAGRREARAQSRNLDPHDALVNAAEWLVYAHKLRNSDAVFLTLRETEALAVLSEALADLGYVWHQAATGEWEWAEAKK